MLYNLTKKNRKIPKPSLNYAISFSAMLPFLARFAAESEEQKKLFKQQLQICFRLFFHSPQFYTFSVLSKCEATSFTLVFFFHSFLCFPLCHFVILLLSALALQCYVIMCYEEHLCAIMRILKGIHFLLLLLLLPFKITLSDTSLDNLSRIICMSYADRSVAMLNLWITVILTQRWLKCMFLEQ